MLRKTTWVVLLLLAVPAFGQQVDYARFFTGATMRVDYYHTGDAKSEVFSLDQVYQAGPWPGSRVNLIDTLNLGKYLVKVFDVATNQLIFSRGFSSLFGEWQTTQEAIDGIKRTFHETVRFPYPRRAVQVVIAVRDKFMHFQDRFSTVIDPNSRFVNRETRSPEVTVRDVMVNGPASAKVDLLILGDGYRAEEMDKFRKDVDHFVKVLFGTRPFSERKRDFNVRAVEIASRDSGIDEPRKNLWRNTALGCAYNSFDLPRYVLSFENRTLRDAAGAAPYDFLYILVNSNRYGGGGIFNLYATCFTGSPSKELAWQHDYVFVHEFGHSFAGLGDEYYSSNVAYTDFYPPGVEPWEPNITALADPEQLKWKALVEPDTPIPTPWDKAAYDSLEQLRTKIPRDNPEEYRRRLDEIQKQQVVLLHRQKYWGKVGAFEGAGYSSTGLYRPFLDCRMFSLRLVDFDPVCRAAIRRMIDFYAH